MTTDLASFHSFYVGCLQRLIFCFHPGPAYDVQLPDCRIHPISAKASALAASATSWAPRYCRQAAFDAAKTPRDPCGCFRRLKPTRYVAKADVLNSQPNVLL
ncbi:MAG: hypothetical protein OXD30_04315 [Bryobacterales bacterium]|nr:hypothetical protein [Bryobacterales bacterium]